MKSIRKEILIDAPATRVWEHLTDPARIEGWLMPNDFQAVAGRAFRMDCGLEGAIECVVQKIIPRKRLVYTWKSKGLDLQTTVDITLREERGQTRLVLVHSGWGKLPPGEVDQGWDACMKKLVAQIKGP